MPLNAPRVALALTINGEHEQVLVGPGDTLLTVLREQLALTGAKRGCDQGVCGACTVLVDNVPQRACLRLAIDCEDQSITTVEGLARADSTGALQKSLAAHGAVQCGFCTPGIVVALSALLARQANPRAEEVRGALSGHLCRCSGYAKIVEAVLGLALPERHGSSGERA
jgi:carbon-monoxide dehydrogenase small subunit